VVCPRIQIHSIYEDVLSFNIIIVTNSAGRNYYENVPCSRFEMSCKTWLEIKICF
jgi:hypothetical protein